MEAHIHHESLHVLFHVLDHAHAHVRAILVVDDSIRLVDVGSVVRNDSEVVPVAVVVVAVAMVVLVVLAEKDETMSCVFLSANVGRAM